MQSVYRCVTAATHGPAYRAGT